MATNGFAPKQAAHATLHPDVRADGGRRAAEGDWVSVVASLVFHAALMVGLAFIPVLLHDRNDLVTLLVPTDSEPTEFLAPQEFAIDIPEPVAVGADSLRSREMARSVAEQIAAVPEMPSPAEIIPEDASPLRANQVVEIPMALHIDNLPVRGAVGLNARGATGAIDRITREILLSLEERPTLVVWLFDQSASLYRQRQEIHDRLDRVYRELEAVEAGGGAGFRSRRQQPLLSSVVAFGNSVRFLTDRPSDRVDLIKEQIASIPLDDTGVERVFQAVYMAADRYKKYRRGRDLRNVMLIAFTDEAGEDQNGVDKTVRLCRRYEMPVYVVGVPAPFGQQETIVKWVDPDPKFDQSPQRGVVEQGPETLLPERIRLGFFDGNDPGPIDSGFGPFALTRLCYETGGIYFTVHPNRKLDDRVGWWETDTYAAHLSYFFDEDVMQPYRPDYVALDEYMRRVRSSKSREALIQAAQRSRIEQMKSPQLRFVHRDAASFNNALSEAQKDAAALEPLLSGLHAILLAGEVDRDQEATARWQAGFDLAMGRVLAARVRTEGYNALLAEAKRGMEFTSPKNNTWILRPAEVSSVSSRLARDAKAARDYLRRVLEEHSGTPWSLLAEHELRTPLGWQWHEQFTPLEPRRRSVARAGDGGARRDDRARRLAAPPPRRPPPKL